MNFRHSAWPALLTAAALGLQAETGAASTCKDELNRFESRLHGSALAADRPQLFQELVREAERAAELRDEQRCLQRVAELKKSLPEDSGPPPATRESSTGADDAQAAVSRPKPPVLLVADGDDQEADTADEQDDEGDQ